MMLLLIGVITRCDMLCGMNNQAVSVHIKLECDIASKMQGLRVSIQLY